MVCAILLLAEKCCLRGFWLLDGVQNSGRIADLWPVVEYVPVVVYRLAAGLVYCRAVGIWAAIKRDTWVDRFCSLIAAVGLSVPDILLALLALLFAASTGWFPVGGAQSPVHDLMSPLQQLWDRAHHLILPALVLAASDLAGIMRQMRSNLLDTLRADYVSAARARGLAEGWVIYKHALRNAINPLLTIFGYSLSALLSGAFIVENIMAWPGLGR